jgi:putative ABC transport system permease protein
MLLLKISTTQKYKAKNMRVKRTVIRFLNLIFLIFKERIREFATLKVMGKNSMTILLTLFFEILLISAIGIIFGMIAGYPLLSLVLAINNVEGLTFLTNISFMSFVSAISVVSITIFVVMIFCFRKVRRIDMIESLKSVE